MNKLNELKEKKLDNKGFSLVELIIVIAIMAILIGVLAPQYMRYVERSRESTDIDAIDSVVSAVATILADPMNDSTSATIQLDGVVVDVTGLTTEGENELNEVIPQMPTMKSSTYKAGGWTITFASDGKIQFSTGEPGESLQKAMGY